MKAINFKRKIYKWLAKGLTPLIDRGWYPVIGESFMGAWQQNVTLRADQALAHPTVYACITQIASDIGKLRLGLTELGDDGVWSETTSPSFSPVLKKPNKFQTRQKFIEFWVISKLIHGNAYILKQRDGRGVVIGLYILDPLKVQPLVSADGAVFYKLASDNLSKLTKDIPAAPASEIIHDTMECLYHPLVGVPPLLAANLAAAHGLNIQESATKFFGNNSNPGGVLTAPGAITTETAGRLKADWETNFTGDNAGKVAVLGDGLKFEPMAFTATDSQLVEQLKWSDEKICSVYKVPPYKVYIGALPSYQNVEILDRIYYAGCLQRLIESIEELLDVGLNMPDKYNTEFKLEDLMRMDASLRMKTQVEGVKGSIITPNEARKQFNLKPLPGGDTVYMQQQNYSLAALNERDKDNPLAAQPAPAAPAEPVEETEEEIEEGKGRLWLALKSKGFEELTNEN